MLSAFSRFNERGGGGGGGGGAVRLRPIRRAGGGGEGAVRLRPIQRAGGGGGVLSVKTGDLILKKVTSFCGGGGRSNPSTPPPYVRP